MEVWFLIAASLIIAWALIRAAGGGRKPEEERAEQVTAHASAPPTPSWRVTDPVCGAVGPVEQAHASVEHAGRVFHFCSERCHERFIANPTHYVEPEDHTPAEPSEGGTAGGTIASTQLAGTTCAARPYLTLDWRLVGLALSSFLAITYVLCVIFGLLFPQHTMYELWAQLLPGFSWSLVGFLLGLLAAFAYGFYTALIFCPLYNAFARLFWKRSSAMVQAGGEGI